MCARLTAKMVARSRMMPRRDSFSYFAGRAAPRLAYQVGAPDFLPRVVADGARPSADNERDSPTPSGARAGLPGAIPPRRANSENHTLHSHPSDAPRGLRRASGGK